MRDSRPIGSQKIPGLSGDFLAETEGFEIAPLVIEVNWNRVILRVLTSPASASIRSVRFDSWQKRGTNLPPSELLERGVGLDHGQQPLGLDEEASRVGTDRVTHAPHVSTDLAEIVSMQRLEVSDTVA